MGSFYSLGIVVNFHAKSQKTLSQKDWQILLKERIDTELFDMVMEDTSVKGKLKDGIFEENIAAFFLKLKTITMDRAVDYYFKNNGTQLSNYTQEYSSLYLKHKEEKITLKMKFALLFIEGKVMAEEFSIEPKLINWLFRHVDFGNKLAGAVTSNIVG